MARRRIEAGLGSVVLRELDDFLNSGAGSLVNSDAYKEVANSALTLWSTRWANTAITGVRIEGVKNLVAALRSIPPDTVLERYDYCRDRALLTVYRESDSRRPIGYQFIHTPEPTVKPFHLELGIVPPKSAGHPPPTRKFAASAGSRRRAPMDVPDHEEIEHG